jgi:hypothetical protein
MSVYDNKTSMLEDLMHKFPRGADVGTCVGYDTFAPNGNVKKRARFAVVAEQVWQREGVSRTMGLVWVSQCDACGSVFHQVTPTHPEDLKELCSFCGCDKYETNNYVDTKAFWSPLQSIAKHPSVKRRGRVEAHILDVMSLFGSESVVKVDELIAKATETLPEPEAGKRDTRRQVVVRAINCLSREKDPPLRVEGGIVIFYQ